MCYVSLENPDPQPQWCDITIHVFALLKRRQMSQSTQTEQEQGEHREMYSLVR